MTTTPSNIIALDQGNGATFEATAFAKRGRFFYSIGMNVPELVTLSVTVLTPYDAEDETKLAHETVTAYEFPEDETEQAVRNFFDDNRISIIHNEQLLSAVLYTAHQYFASSPELEILIAIPKTEAELQADSSADQVETDSAPEDDSPTA